MHQTGEQKKAALQQRIAALRMRVRRIEKREVDAERRARNQRLIIGGALVEEHALKNPNSEFARAYGRLLAQRVEAKDRPLFAEQLGALMPADEVAALLGDTTAALPAAE